MLVDQQCAFSSSGLALFTGAQGAGKPVESVDEASGHWLLDKAVRLTEPAFAFSACV